MEQKTSLRRVHSLRNVSEENPIPEDTKVSVLQLVAQYQSTLDLRNALTEEERKKILHRNETPENKMEMLKMVFEKKADKKRSGIDRSIFSHFQRSKSMEHLPIRKADAGVNICALRAVFEPKGSPIKRFHPKYFHLPGKSAAKHEVTFATPWHIAASTYEKPEKYTSGRGGKVKEQLKHRKEERSESRTSVPGVQVQFSGVTEHSYEQNQQNLEPEDKNKDIDRVQDKPVPTVKELSELYLSKITTRNSADSPPKAVGLLHDSVPHSDTSFKTNKMAEKTEQMKATLTNNGQNLDCELPPPPPAKTQQEELASVRDASESFIPVPPPKETFSEFYQQRQKNELKRLYKHMHPELRKNLEDVVNEEFVEVMNAGDVPCIDAGLQGEVQSMRWIFENWALDSIGEHHATKKMLEEESVPTGNVKSTSSCFECHAPDSLHFSTSTAMLKTDQGKGDVRTTSWLFETQPLDSLNKIYPEEGDVLEAVLKEPVQGGDVKGARLLFESYPLDTLGRCNSVEDYQILKLKSEIQEQKGDVQKSVKLFETEPCCAIRDDTGNIHEIKSICREEVQTNSVRTARWLFETQPLDIINKGASGVRIIRGISLEEAQKGGVDKKRWMFETQPLDTIQETIQEDHFRASMEVIEGSDVVGKRLLFETQPLDSLKGESSSDIQAREEMVGGDVKSTLWLFETQPIETLKDSCEVGHLKKVTVTEDERGAVKQRKLEFETKSLETLNKEASNITQIEKGDVKLYQQLFETLPLDSISASDNECNAKREEVLVGNVKGNRHLFESTPLYAIRDNSGYYYKVTTVSREEVIKGDVQKCRWMFETKPLDQFDEEAGNVKIIKGITRQESCTGEVKTAKWLFETQPLDSIHKQINQTEESLGMKKEISERGDVSTCRWLFETQPMDVLYEKSDTIKEGESIPKADVKSYTWLFETQPLDAIKENTEKYLKVCDVYQDDVKNVDVKTVRHLFETESLDSSTSLQTGEQAFRCLSKVDIQSGDVSRVKEVFETKAIDSIGASSVKVSEVGDEGESIQAGSVHKFTWLFENGVIDTINSTESNKQHTCEVKPGEVGNKRFVFETFSLDQIHHLNKESECVTDSTEETLQKGDVKSSVLLFESQPLYAIQDKDGLFHEVTTVKKEEIMSGNVRGARWMFETKPLDSIKPEDEIYLIRAVTQEDIEKGDVKTARWRFETQPLDSFILGEKTVVKTVDDIQKGDVQSNKQIFECQRSNQKYVRMVSVSDVHRGDVRTSTWLFENQPIDSLKGGFQESTSVQKVHREDSHKGDVKRCTWLFETQPLDTLKDSEISSTVKTQEEMSQADVKRTTWLFETTPLDKFSSEHATNQSMQITESIKETLHRLSSFCAIRSHGIIIEANETTSVKMAKYQLTNSEGPMIQKDELVEGNIEAIMLQLLCTMNVEPHGILLKEDDQGNVNVTKLDLSVHHAKASSLTETEHTRADVAHALDNLLSQDKSVKKGILIQESNKGSVEMTVYSLFSQSETIKGDVKSTISNLLASTQEHKAAATIRLEESEKGNVNLYKTCIEKGELDYLKSCQDQTSEDTIDSRPKDQVDIIQGDVEGAKRHFGQIKESVERTVTDIVPGDVRSTKKVFLSENSMVSNVVNKEEILRGDVSSAKQSLNQAVKQPLVIQKEEIVSGDIKATLKSLEEAKNQSLKQERKTIVPGTIYDIQLPTEEITFTESGNEETLGHFSGCTAEEKHREEKISQARSASEESVTADHEASMQSLQQETAKQQMLHHHIQEKQDVFSQFAGQQQQMQQQIQVKQESKKVEKTVMQKKKMTCMTTVKESATLSTSQQKKLSSTTTVKESATSSTSQQKFLPTQPKVSKSVDLQGARQQTDACQGNEVSKSADINLKPVASATVNTTVNPFLSSDYDSQTVQEKSEKELVVKGDVKAAIKSLHNAAAEQRPLEKEEVVRGDLQAALQSLQKSSVNVSKGDFKAAMIYRNAGQSLSVSRKKGDNESVCNQSCAVSLSSSDTEFPTPVSVIDGGFQPSAVVTHPCETKTRSERSDCPTASKESVLANPPKSPEKVSPLKPALPPKPEHLTAGTSGRKGQKPSLPLKPDHLKERQQGPTVLLKDTPQKLPKSASFQQLPSKSLPCREVIQADATESLEKESHKEFSCHNEESHREGQIGSKQVCNKASRTSNPVAEKKNEVESKIQNKEQSAEVKLYTSGLSSESHNEKSNVKSLPQTIIATKDLQCSMQSDSKEGVTSMNTHQDFQASLHKFGGRRTGYVNVTSGSEMVKDDVAPIVVSPKKVRISQGDSTENTYKSVDEELRMQKEETIIDSTSSTSSEQLAKNVRPDGNAASEQKQLQCPPERPSKQQENKVILREKKRKNETEDERRQRLSVHKEEIMRGNVKAAMEIFENLRKKEELQIILSKVEELEGETLKVDVRSMRKFFENVPKWIVTPSSQVNQSKLKEAQKVKVTGSVKDDTESTSPVGVVFEDLERASAEIVRLKEQTLAKLMDIEEAIKKALFSVSSLKSEADIAGLSGLFRESLSTDEPIANTNSIRKISIVSSRSKSDDVKPVFESNSPLLPQADGEQKPSLEIPVTKPRASSPSSPSFISIQSAARKTSDPLTPKNSEKHIVNEVSSSDSTAFTPQESKPKNTAESSSLRGPNNESIRNVSSVSVDSVCSPLNPRRQKSVIAFQTIPEVPGIVGTKTVTEKYEEMDCFGNRIITSKTSTTVTKQSETKTSSTYEVVASPTRYEVMASPVLRRHAHSLAENNQCNGKVKEGGVVIVTFGSPKLGKK